MCWFFSEAQNTQAPSDTRQKAHALYFLRANQHSHATTPLYTTVLLPGQSFFSLRGQLFYTSVDIGKQNSGLMLRCQCVLGRHLTRIIWCGVLLWRRCILSLRQTVYFGNKVSFFEFLTGFSGFSGCESDSKVCLRRSLCRSVRSEYALQPSPWHLYTETNAKNKKNRTWTTAKLLDL